MWLHLWSEHASFTRPEMKVEPVRATGAPRTGGSKLTRSWLSETDGVALDRVDG